MTGKPTYAVIGAGALGGYYGALLHRAGFEVHFLLHSDFEHVRTRGLRIDSTLGDFHLPEVHAHGTPHSMPRCDVALIALKTTRNAVLRDILPLILKPEGVAVVLQNGLGVEDDVATIVGPGRVAGGLCFLCSNKAGPGHIQHLDYGAVIVADYSPDGQPRGITPRIESIVSDFVSAGIDASAAEDLILARWKKLVWNIPYNGLSVVLDALTDELMNNPRTRELVVALMGEVVTGAAAVGRTIPDSFVARMLDDTTRMAPYRTSMKID